MQLHEIYLGIIRAVGLNADEDGMVYRELRSKQKRPYTVNHEGEVKRLVIPTPEVLSKGIPAGCIAFHPMSENLVRGESDVLENLRSLMRKAANDRLSKLMATLAIIAGDTSLHSTLHPDQTELVTSVPKADAKFISRIESLIKKNKSRVSIYLKRGGEIKGEKYDRACIVKFALTPDEARTLDGVSLRVDDVKSLHSLVDFILPGYETEAYCEGSNSSVAPYFAALLTSYSKLVTRFNEITEMFRDFIDDEDDASVINDFLLDDSWFCILDNLSKYAREIPPLDGNEGTRELTTTPAKAKVKVDVPEISDSVSSVSATVSKEPVPAAVPAHTTTTVTPIQNTATPISHANVPVAPTNRGSVAMGDVMKAFTAKGTTGYATAPAQQTVPQGQATLITDANGNQYINVNGQLTPVAGGNMNAVQPQVHQAMHYGTPQAHTPAPAYGPSTVGGAAYMPAGHGYQQQQLTARQRAQQASAMDNATHVYNVQTRYY